MATFSTFKISLSLDIHIYATEPYPSARIQGAELDPNLVSHAQQRCKEFAGQVTVEQGDAFALQHPEESLDLVVCRHVLQAVPEPEKVVSQCQRVMRPGGWLHLVLEDYTMIHMEGRPKLDRFWLEGPLQFGLDTHCDLRIGRRGISLLEGMQNRKLGYVVVDTERVSRQDFADTFTAWRDGYSEAIAPYLGSSVAEVFAIWDEMIHIIRTGYALWQVPIASGQKATAFNSENLVP